ncbi:hypothetical protein QA641_03810 [Bradyrhizobium sp. CB1650]|uniref:antibiotic biosynthesis monooxygenase family protein n=1 Tax=Bradyrhizobium sp. CB1650 TaxID=3039153 RepID=UPI0024361189|nr:hypothetical protein [Bradyrhizobium sp. CB1650]WGD53079.1 hypothetical protein QA641_03810 [Bradyrhizobium sp. CB1650]
MDSKELDSKERAMTKVTTINTLVLKPEHVAEYIASQREFTSAISAVPNGPLGGRLYKSIQGTKIVLVSQFDSLAAQTAVMGRPELAAQIEKLRPFVESSSPALYEEAFTYGGFR